MTPTDLPDLDEATRAAVAALAHRVQARDAAEEKPDPEPFALEFVIAMRGQGWRLTAARPAEPWQHAGQPPSPETTARGAELARAALRGEEIE